MRIANPKDNRQWTAIHKEVSNVNNRTVSSLSVLTPPQEGQESTRARQCDVNAVGPGGITPLMLAVSRGNYLDGAYDDENSDDSGAQVCDIVFISNPSRFSDTNIQVYHLGNFKNSASMVNNHPLINRLLEN